MSHTVMVTGADGFIGSHLAEELVKSGEKVRAFCLYNSFGSLGWIDTLPPEIRNEMDIFMGDVRDPNGVRTAMRGQERVFHLAALIAIPFSYHSPDSYVDTNIKGTLNVLNAARELDTQRVLVTSTSEVYGDPDVHPQPESYWGHVNPNGIRSCYDEGKRCAEALFFSYRRQNNVNIKVGRIFNTYGPKMHPNDGRVVSNFIVQALKGEPITIYGDGSQTRSFCYVDDLVECMCRLMATPDDFTGPVNMGNPGEFTIRELAEKVIELTNSSSRLICEPLPGDDPKQRRPDISLAREVLGWEPKVQLEEGLKKTIAYFDEQIRKGLA